jgi:uncharacterized membrane protein
MNKRRFYKTITWRIIASTTTFVVAYIVTGQVAGSGVITIANAVAKTGFYYIHEYAWDKCNPLNNKEEEVIEI